MAQRSKGRSRRKTGRILAPVALIASTVAVVMIVHSGNRTSTQPDPRRLEGRHSSTTKARPAPASGTTTAAVTGGRSVTVRPGDTPSGIAQREGITLARLLVLNPGLKPTSLQVGQKLATGP